MAKLYVVAIFIRLVGPILWQKFTLYIVDVLIYLSVSPHWSCPVTQHGASSNIGVPLRRNANLNYGLDASRILEIGRASCRERVYVLV